MSGFHKKNNEAAVDPNAVNADATPVARVRLPKKWAKEQFALAETMLGANHIRVQCMDGVTRMGRIKGQIKKRAWIRERRHCHRCPLEFPGREVRYHLPVPQATDRVAAEEPVPVTIFLSGSAETGSGRTRVFSGIIGFKSHRSISERPFPYI